MKVLPIAYQKQWGVNYSINDKRRDFMSDNNKKVEEKAAEIIQATETQTVKPAAAENKEFKKKKSTTWERNQRKWGWAFILPTMIGIIVLNLWPIVQTIYQSFCKVGSFGDSSFAGFANYKKMFADPEVWQSLLNTFKYAIIEVPFSIAIALILAVFLNRKMHGRTIYRAIFFLPMVVAPAAVAMGMEMVIQFTVRSVKPHPWCKDRVDIQSKDRMDFSCNHRCMVDHWLQHGSVPCRTSGDT